MSCYYPAFLFSYLLLLIKIHDTRLCSILCLAIDQHIDLQIIWETKEPVPIST